MAENVAQAASFVTSGAADIGIIAKSLAVLPSARAQSHFVEIPANEYPPIQQACVLLKSSTKQEAARRFLTYIQNPEASKIFSGMASTSLQQKQLRLYISFSAQIHKTAHECLFFRQFSFCENRVCRSFYVLALLMHFCLSSRRRTP